MEGSLWPWLVFFVLVVALLALDLGIFNRKAHVISVGEAARFSGFTVLLALAFAGAIALDLLPVEGAPVPDALEFLTGYLIELALSVDNIFVFILIFSYFGVPARYQHRVLFWGVLGALLMRGVMIGAGSALIAEFHWVTYIFGAFLVVTGVRMAVQDETEIEPQANPVLRLVRRVLPITPDYHGQHFFVRAPLAATPLFVVLIMVETTDLVFALDSIPAIFAVTRKPYLIYTSNIFAILALRSLYFLLAGVLESLRFLKFGLSVVLVFIGAKMLATYWRYELPIGLSLAVVVGVLALSVVASLLAPAPPEERRENKETSE